MWQVHDSGVVSGGDCGGDYQVGKSFSKRFVRADLPGSLVTVSIYVAQHAENDGHEGCEAGTLDLYEEIEYMLCRDPKDPGGTEEWSDYVHSGPLADLDGRALDLPSVEHAEKAAQRLLESWVPGIVSWDGVSTT